MSDSIPLCKRCNEVQVHVTLVDGHDGLPRDFFSNYCVDCQGLLRLEQRIKQWSKRKKSKEPYSCSFPMLLPSGFLALRRADIEFDKRVMQNG